MDLVTLAAGMGLDGTLGRQGGVLRRDQALAVGLSRSRIDDLLRRGKWSRLLPAVYLVGGDEPTARQRIRAAWLWGGPACTIGLSSSAFWQGLHGNVPHTIDLLIPATSRLRGQPQVRVSRAAVAERDWRWHDFIRVTTIARTCLDLARDGVPHQSEDALRLNLVDLRRFEKSLAEGYHRRGQVAARELVADLAAGPWSGLETLSHRHLRVAGITGWVANLRVVCPDGTTAVIDIAFEQLRLAIEIDGFQAHSGRVAHVRDRRRQNALVALGWTVLRFTHEDLRSPETFIPLIRAAIARLETHAR